MWTLWDASTEAFRDLWRPRLYPYARSLVEEVGLSEGERVLVLQSMTGAKALTAARRVGAQGSVKVAGTHPSLLASIQADLERADLAGVVTTDAASAETVLGGPWSAIVGTFQWFNDETSLERGRRLRPWVRELDPEGRVAVLLFGPPAVGSPLAILRTVLGEVWEDVGILEPEVVREKMAQMFEGARLGLVRFTVVQHTFAFDSVERFFTEALSATSLWGRWNALSVEMQEHLRARVYDALGGPRAPVVLEPIAAIGIAAKPGIEVKFPGRPSLKAPPLG